MNAAKIKSYLEVSTNLAVLLVALLILGSFAWNFFGKSSAIKNSPGLATGKYLSQVQGIDYNQSPKTMLIAMSTECHSCADNVPFYKQLVETQNGRNNPIRIVGVFPETKSNVEQYLHQHLLNIDSVSSVDFASLNIAGTSTIVLIDNRGRILDFWIGKLSKESEQEIIKMIS